MSEKRFIKVRVRNLDLMKGSKCRDIYTNEADGTNITIQDGVEVELSEYAYSNLKTAIQEISKQGPKDPNDLNSPAPLISTYHSKVDIVELSDFYTKDITGKPVYPKKEKEKDVEELQKEIESLKAKIETQDKRKEDFDKEVEDALTFIKAEPEKTPIPNLLLMKEEMGINDESSEEQKAEFVKRYNENLGVIAESETQEELASALQG